MDSRTQKILSSIGMQIPKELLNSLMVEEKNDQKAMVEDMLGNKKIPAHIRARLKRAYDAGMFNKKDTKVNEEVQAKIDDFVTGKIRKAVRDKRIAKPDFKNDPFLRKIRKETQ